MLAAVLAAIVTFGGAACAQGTQYPKPTELPNPYRLVAGWPTLPKNMNGGHWGEVIRVVVDPTQNVWVFHRCFNVVPPGSATCINRGPANPPILEFDASGKLLKSFGAGIFAYPHGFTMDRDGNLWASDVNDQPTILGTSAKNAAGVIMGQEVLKLSPEGKVLMTLGKEGVAGTGPDTFDRPTGVANAPNGEIFVADGHYPNKHDTAQEGNFIAAWKQFGQPSSVFVGKDDTIYVGASFPDPQAKKGELRGIIIGNAKDGSLKAFIPDPADLDQVITGTSASGIAADDKGAIYGADVGTHNLRKYVKVN